MDHKMYESPEIARSLKRARGRVASKILMEPPTNGINTRDSLDNMSERDAVVLENWTPDLGKLRVRGGRREHTDSDDIVGHTPSHVESLLVYESGSAKHLLAADNGAIYNVTSIGAPGDVLKDSLATSRLESANFGGNLIIVGNGIYPQTYNGTAISKLECNFDGGGERTDTIGCLAYKNRMYYWIVNSQDVYYSALDTPGASLSKFQLGYMCKKGGHLVCMTTWTQDGGSGPDDLAIFIMSSGEVLVYRGSSPAAYADWAIVGTYDIGVPLSCRSVVKFGTDLIVSTEFDYVFFSEVIEGKEAKVSKTKITGDLKQSVIDYGTNWGWDTTIFNAGKLAIFNVPITTNVEAKQHVINLVTGAWTIWTGHNANCWAEFNGKLYFGGASGKVYQAEYQYDDEGSPIQSIVQPAWNSFRRKENKNVIALFEHYRAGNSINVSNVFAANYEDFPSHSFPPATDSVGTAWGSDWGSEWASGGITINEWNLAYGEGMVISMEKKLNTKQLVEWLGMVWLIDTEKRL